MAASQNHIRANRKRNHYRVPIDVRDIVARTGDKLSALQYLLRKIRQLSLKTGSDNPWNRISKEEWPTLFGLFDVGQGLHRLLQVYRAGELLAVWPSLEKIIRDGLAIQDLISQPTIVPEATPERCYSHQELDEAKAHFSLYECVNIDFLFPDRDKVVLQRAIKNIREVDNGRVHVDLKRGEFPNASDLFRIVDERLISKSIFQVTGYTFSAKSYRIAIIDQNLPSRGLCWHRDLEWPLERNVVTIIHSLKKDSPRKGGAFLYYAKDANEIRYFYRSQHHSTLINNSEPRWRRIFHAVSGYNGKDTSRETMVIQCIKDP